MGIRPNGSGAIPPVTPDNPETRYSDWLTDLEDSGEIVGGVWKETDAKATSAGDGVTDLAGRVAAIETAPVKQHTHDSSEITGTTTYADNHPAAFNRLIKTGADGFLYSRDNPANANHLTRKGYVDGLVGAVEGAPVKPHTHDSADITGTTTYADSHAAAASRVMKTGGDGFLHSRDDPTHANHLARKGYVDALESRVETLETLVAASVIAVPPALVADLPAGQVYLDTASLTLYTKD